MTDDEKRSIADLLSNDPQFSALISNQLAEHIDKRVKDREDRQLKMLGVITAVVVFLGYSGIKEMINSASLIAVDTAFARRTIELEVPVYLATLATYVAKAKNEGKFSNTERGDMVATLEKLAELRKKGIAIADSTFFSTTLESVIDIMAASDNDYFVDRIFDLYTDDCLKVSSIVQTLSPHYGRQMIVGLGDIRIEGRRRFQLTERSASTHKITEFALIHRMLFDFKEAGLKKNPATDEAIKSIKPLEPKDKAMAFKFINEYANETWVKKPTRESLLLRELSQAFLRTYGTELATVGILKP